MTRIQEIGRPSAEAVGILSPSRGKRLLLFAGGAMGVVAVVLLIIWIASPSDKLPALNADTPTLAAFVSTQDYLDLPFELQERYMRVLEDREDNGELKRAFVGGKLTEEQYRAAIQEAWLGEQLKRAQKYASLPAGPERVAFINELLDRKGKGKDKDKDKNKDGGQGAADNPAGSEDREDADVIKRDPSASQLRIDSWPAAVQDQFTSFRAAYDEQKEARDKAAAAATTRAARP